MNRADLVGRICSDVELTTSTNGTSIARPRIAVQRRFKNKQTGEYETDFISTLAFSNTAEYIVKYCKKGDLVALSGSIQTGNYEKDGQRVYTTEVLIDNINRLEKRESNGQQNNGVFGNTSPADFLNNGNTVDDELPF